jgi:phage FluMu protein Com
MSTETDTLTEYFKEQERIRCPHCKEVNEDDEYQHVSTYGTIYNDDGAYEHECGWCGVIFFIYESVQRTYRTGKTRDEARGY